ncbi:MAG: hypothetical protein D6726_07750 [Nitrospirae bacterium]|nr:MAG: hypothetical protein D6726_07750 [Nitrospirota bacterium]
MKGIRGKSLKAIVWDIAEGYVTVNPLFLKPIDIETIKELYREIQKVQVEIRGEKFPYGDVYAIRIRNTRLQRLNSSQMIIRNYLRQRREMVY